MSALLTVEKLKIVLKKTGQTLVRQVDFSLGDGQSLILLGQSGSGKTLTCRAVMGLLDPRHFQVDGAICFQGGALSALTKQEKRKLYGGEIAFIPQNPMTALDPSVRIGKQMVETLRLHSGAARGSETVQVLSALEDAGLWEPERMFKSYPHELSGGMLQRVLIAMVLMVHARLVVADEPTTALDVVHRNETIAAFEDLRDKGTSILMVTHDFAAAVQLGGQMLVMKDGCILERGDATRLLAAPENSYTRALIAASSLSSGEVADHA